MTKILYEHRTTKRRIYYPPKLVDTLAGLTGFRSIYGFPADTAAMIADHNGTWGLEGMPLYSDQLLVDFDDAPEAAKAMGDWLLSEGYSHSAWDSGGRSVHYHISIEPMLGANIQLIQRAWMRKYWPAADTSIYMTSGMFRLPGTYHDKNPGQRKTMKYGVEGSPLQLDDVRSPELNVYTAGMPTEDDTSERILDMLILTPASSGNRNNHMFKIAATCYQLGMDYEEAIRTVEAWNTTLCIPRQSSLDITSTVRSAYRKGLQRKAGGIA